MNGRRTAYALGALVLLVILVGLALTTPLISGLSPEGAPSGIPPRVPAASRPETQSIREGLANLKNRLEAKLARSPNLPEEQGEAFWNSIDELLAESGGS